MCLSMSERSRNREYVEGGVTLKGEVEETESSRGSGVQMSQSRRDGNYSALSWMMYLHVSFSFTLDYITLVSINCRVVIVA